MDNLSSINIPSINTGSTAIDTLLSGVNVNLEKSNTYRWSGALLKTEVGDCIPIVYGRHRLAGQLLNAFVEEGENETLCMLLGVCEGEVQSISNIEVNNSPIEKFYGDNPSDPYGKSAEVSLRMGTNTQTPIDGFADLHNVSPISHTLVFDVPYVFTGLVNDSSCFRIELEIDKLYQLDEDNNMLSWYMSLRIEYKLHTDTVWKFLGNHEISKTTTTVFKRYFKSPYLPQGLYDVRITKLTAEANESTTFGNVSVVSLDEIVTENLSYPYTAVAGVRLLAIQNLKDQITNVTFLVTGKKVRVPKVTYTVGGNDLVDWEDYYYDPITSRFRTIWNDAVVNWDGVSYVTAWSANPVWCLRDLMINQIYGLGEFVSESMLDDSTFLASALYCETGVDDTMGHKEKRFRIDIVLDMSQKANDVIAMMLQSFRGLIDTSSGKVRLTIEQRGNPVQLFTMSNIIVDSLTITYQTDKVPNLISCSFTNKDKGYKRDSVEMSDEVAILNGENIRQQSAQFVGCTRVSQVLREATILLNKLKLNRTILSFQTYWDSVLCQPNDVFEFQHVQPAWGEGGRVKTGSTYLLVKLDKAIVIESGHTYELKVRNNSNDSIESNVINEIAGTYTEVRVVAPFSFVPEEYDVWALGVQNVDIKKHRLLSLVKRSDGRVDIQAVSYNEDIYDDTAIVAPEDNYVHFSLDIPNVSDLTLFERVSRSISGAITDQIEVSFKKPPVSSKYIKQAVRFEIYLSDNDGASWSLMGSTQNEYFIINRSFQKEKLYYVAVASVSENGEKNLPSVSPKQSVIVEGWKESPVIVDGFTYTFTDEILLKWNKNPETDVIGYEIRLNDYGWGQSDSNLVWRGLAESYTIVRPTARNGVRFYVRAFNSSGIYSTQSVSLVPNNPAPVAPVLTVVPMFQKAFLGWQDISDLDIMYYEVWRRDDADFTGIELGLEGLIHKSNGSSAIVEIDVVPRTYYRIRGVDKFGGGEWSNVVYADVITLGSSDISAGVINTTHIQAGSINAGMIQAGAIQAQHLAVNSIYACHLAVGELSGLSANLGCITAGCITGALIKTSNDLYRTEINQTGFYSYDTQGRLVVKLSQGNFCLIDPANSNYYSYIDAGQLKFHTPWEDIPHVKRMASGYAVAGETITLCRWTSQPNIVLGLKKLTTYNSGVPESSQEWCVYYDNVRCFNSGGSNFGWKFDIHACLTVSGGTRPECFWDIGFDVTRSTGVCTCAVIIRNKFQLWCNQQAPSNYFYGSECYEIRYRVQGSGTWCSCLYDFAMPYSQVCELKKNVDYCQTLQLPCSAQWELQSHRISLNWYDSGLASGSYQCCLCCYQYQLDCSYWLSCTVYANGTYCHRSYTSETCTNNIRCCFIDTLNFGSFSGGLVCDNSLSYTMQGSYCQWSTGTPGVSTNSIMCVSGLYGGGGCYTFAVGFMETKTGSFNSLTNQNFGCYLNSLSVGSMWCFHNSYTLIIPGWMGGFSCAIVNACQVLCYKKCQICYFWCCFWYNTWCGLPAVCTYERFYSVKEMSGLTNTLDSAGEVSYLAMAYS